MGNTDTEWADEYNDWEGRHHENSIETTPDQLAAKLAMECSRLIAIIEETVVGLREQAFIWEQPLELSDDADDAIWRAAAQMVRYHADRAEALLQGKDLDSPEE